METKILEKAYQTATKSNYDNINVNIKQDVDLLIEKIDSNKSILAALVTSLVKKIANPKQDVRLHRTDFKKGYSARSLDTKITTPFFKKYFPKYANKESSFLTLATRERIKWNLREGKNLKIRNKELKASFLNIFNQIETHGVNPKIYLNYILFKLIDLTKGNEKIFKSANKKTAQNERLNIPKILKMLKAHFKTKNSSRLPVIAIYSIYETLISSNFNRYKKRKLLPLQVHTSSDKKGYGDIEIYDYKNQAFEVIEVKHNIPIDEFLIFDIIKKTKNTPIKRYYILTTFDAGFEDADEQKKVEELISQIRNQSGLDIIVNGILTTLKYYLRFIDDYQIFIEKYTKNLTEDARNSTEVRVEHVEAWMKILKNKK